MSASQYHAQVDALLKSITELNGRIYDTYVPDSLPTDPAGYVLPYVLLASGPTADIGDPDLSGMFDPTVHDWRAQTNCVGPSPAHARLVGEYVVTKLANARVGKHWLQPDRDAFITQLPVKDDGVKPARFFLPLFWTLTTTI